jgi:hypothetical protein
MSKLRIHLFEASYCNSYENAALTTFRTMKNCQKRGEPGKNELYGTDATVPLIRPGQHR